MANIIKKWRRVIAVGCTHGALSNPKIQQQVLDFKKRWSPAVTFELGDVIDTAAFRAGARGTADEAAPVEPDKLAAVDWLERYEPTNLAWGNHDWRLKQWMDSPNAVVAHAAGAVWKDLNDAVKKLKCATVPYDFEHNWFHMGGTYWGHGFWFNESSVRDHAEFLGGPVVMAHLHQAQMVSGRTRSWSNSFCVGTLADIQKLSYARRNRATSRWNHGCVFGEISDTSAQLWLSVCEPNGDLKFPV